MNRPRGFSPILTSAVLCAALNAQPRTVKPEDLCSLEGRVLNAATGAPLADVKLKLRPAAPPPGTVLAFVTSTDENGNFAFARIDPGAYRFSAERPGYATANYGERRSNLAGLPITLQPADRKTGLEFKLKPLGVIAGRVFDPDGEPLGRALNQGSSGDAMILVQRFVYENGRRTLRPMSTSVAKNDLGEYRIAGLEPGRYLIYAEPLRMQMGRVAQEASGQAPQTYRTTYCPSAASPADATPLDVTAGAVVTGADIRMIRTEAFRARITVVDLTGLNLRNLTLTVVAPSGGGIVYGALGPRGEFDLGQLPRGRLTLIAGGYNTQGPALWTRYAVDVNGPVDKQELAVKPGFTIQGRLTVENATIPKGLKFSLTMPDMPQAARSTAKPAEPAPNGSFAFTNVSADRYSVDIAGMPKGFYLKSIRLGAQDGLEDELDLTQPPERPLEIVIGATPGAIAGSVKSANDAPASGVTVVLVPQDAKRRERPDWYRTTATAADGKFAMADIRPGDYHLFAFEDVEDGAWMDPAFLKPMEAGATPVTIREGASEKVELKSIPAQ
jgi:5-hydroxyisourate hydrolase-like protein (transthyretin family)